MVDSSKTKVVVSPKAFASMALHASCHASTIVHGALVGTAKDGAVHVVSAVPICHETPSKPLLDSSLAMVQAQLPQGETIVGWFTAPETLTDECKPGPVALRIVANLNSASPSSESVLIVIDNAELASVITGKTKTAAQAIQAFGKDFGDQWMEPVKNVSIEKDVKVAEAVCDAHKEDVAVHDFVDHLEDSPTTEWYPNDTLSKYVDQYC